MRRVSYGNSTATYSDALFNDLFGPCAVKEGEPVPCCPDCGRPRDKRFIVLFGKKREVWAENCGCWEKNHPKKRPEAKTAERIPLAYIEADFSWFPELRDWVEDPGKGAILTGRPGTGKTWAACAALKAWAATGKGRAVFCRAWEIIDAAHDAYGTHKKGDVVARYTSPSLLAIDDLGKENPTDFAVDLIFRVINERGEAELPTIITTNYDADKLFARLSKRSGDEVSAAAIMSRLATYRAINAASADRRIA